MLVVIDVQKLGDKFPNVNVITIDYRGFGNSQGTPSEEGLRMDARATWDWLVERGGNWRHDEQAHVCYKRLFCLCSLFHSPK